MSNGDRPWHLPAGLHGLAQARLAALLRPAGASTEDFAAPAGEAALSPAGGLGWRVCRNPVTMFVGGVAAVVLELAEPRVRTGVWEHTAFRTDPLGRLQRTGYAAMMTVYGPRSRAAAMIAGVNRRHATIAGRTPAGEAYRADDPELLAWVQATAAFGFLAARERLVAPLAPAERDAYYAEGGPAARLYGVTAPPADAAAVEALFDDLRPRLEPSPIVTEFLRIVLRMPALPVLARPVQRLLVRAAVDCLPGWTRTRLALDGPDWSLPPAGTALLRRLARGADRLVLSTHPGVQACARLGLAPEALYRDGP